MSPAGIMFYDVVLFVHILAVIVAFGVTFAYPILDAVARRSSGSDLVALHRFQVALTRRLITPAMVVVLAAGLYLALDRWSLGDGWISATFLILIVLFGMVGAVFAPTERRLLALAERGEGSGGAPGPEYEREARKLQIAGPIASLLIVAAVFIMVTKPGV